MLKNVLFDLDGTLTDPTEGIVRCIKYALDQLHRPCPDEIELRSFIGVSIHPTFENLLNSVEKNLVQKAIDIFRERYSKVGLFENEIYPGITELLTFLHRNLYKLYVVTVKPQVYADRIVRHFPLGQWFNGVFGPELDEYYPDKTRLIASILTNLGLVPEETVIIGDRREDIIAGKTNATVTIGVTYGYGSKEEIIGAAPEYICRNTREIQQAIMNH